MNIKPGDAILLHKVYHKLQSYDVWFLGYGAWQSEFFVILDHFLNFYPLNTQKNQNFEKMKKVPRDIIILHKCTINDNHMMYDSWDMEHDGHIFLSFWTIFCTFTPLTTRNQNLKNEKSTWRYNYFTQIYQKLWLYATLFLRYDAWCK